MPKPDFYIREIKLIHIAKKQLGLDDDSYRAILKNYGGHDSSARMTSQQRNKVLDRFKALGFTVTPRQSREGGKKTLAGRITSSQQWRLKQLCIRRGWKGLSDPGLQAFIKRTAKVDHWSFLTRRKASYVITGLERWLK